MINYRQQTSNIENMEKIMSTIFAKSGLASEKNRFIFPPTNLFSH
ncbi:hypothetical protein HMPREF0602_0309 [Neisseria meningitidis ATCC 13091]|uniref:Uncharacterized protein n=2 Tax=Neisseria meningitidis TaxID=487 RepID=A0A0H5QEJ3_NEIMI|nr:hypothetical protein HMPREF0602_0309 [Neisseria meningitidis ATCC 13091]CRZ00359.1 hypothetical protein [Neisseria meningitidis serogroup B]